MRRGVRQVEDEVQVHVVAADAPVDETLGVRERRRVRKRLVEVGPDVGKRLDVGSRFCRFFTRSACVSLTSLVAVSLNVPSLFSAVTNGAVP